MNAITLHQPWASLIAAGVKSILTRSWRAPAGLIGERIAIHAAAKRPRSEWFDHGGPPSGDPRDLYAMDHCYMSTESVDGGDFLYQWIGPLGAVVASAVLADCVPIVNSGMQCEVVDRLSPERLVHTSARYTDDPAWRRDISDQLPYGDFASGRWAWLLSDVKPTTERCPWCWGRGCTCSTIPCSTSGANRAGSCGSRCRSCNGTGSCDPVPAKGRQRIWTWEP